MVMGHDLPGHYIFPPISLLLPALSPPLLHLPHEQVSFGRDFEQQLSFYVEARANFTNLDQVLIFLIHVSCITDTIPTNATMFIIECM